MKHFITSIISAIVVAALVGTSSVAAQSARTKSGEPSKTPDLNGVWQAPYTPNLEQAFGRELPFTAHGAERWKEVDTAQDPTGQCLPVGPARGIQAPMPFQIVQTPTLVTILFEYQRTFRIIYLDGRKRLPDQDPEWFGHSVGRWEGNTLVVETTDITHRTWLDTAGHEHSDKLKLTERFQKVADDNITWSVTFDDPVFFKQPWTVTRPLKRQDTMIMSYSCEENEKDRPHLVPTKKK